MDETKITGKRMKGGKLESRLGVDYVLEGIYIQKDDKVKGKAVCANERIGFIM